MQYIRDIEKMVLSMIQPDPLPGSYRHDTAGIQEIVDHALRETEMVAENHFDGIIVQNMNDMPIRQESRPEAIAYMTRISYEIKKPDLLIGKSGSIIRVASCQEKCNRLCLRRRFPV